MMVDGMQDGMSHRGFEVEWPCRLPEAARQRARVESESGSPTRAPHDSAPSCPNTDRVTWCSTRGKQRSTGSRAHGKRAPDEQNETAENDARRAYEEGIEVQQREEDAPCPNRRFIRAQRTEHSERELPVHAWQEVLITRVDT